MLIDYSIWSIEMKIIIIRHGDPDYSIDSLTEKGWREAALLAERIAPMKVDEYCCSPLGRAQATASLTLKKADRQAVTLDWMREFSLPTNDPDTGLRRNVAWDAMPSYWTKLEGFFDKDKWFDTGYIGTGEARKYYSEVSEGLDEVLARHGYTRDENMYHTDCGNRDVVVFFCHFGVEAVMLSHLLNISPMTLWHGMIALPTSVTTLISEEREEGSVYFRCCGFGDISHLYAGGEEAAFSGRFCELFAAEDERH